MVDLSASGITSGDLAGPERHKPTKNSTEEATHIHVMSLTAGRWAKMDSDGWPSRDQAQCGLFGHRG